MNRKMIFSIVAILCLVCGLLFLVLPNEMMSIYGAALDVHAGFITRFMGSWILAMGLIFWPMRKAESIKTAVKACLYSGLLLTFLGVVISIWDLLVTKEAGLWLNIALYGIPFILLVYFYFKKIE